MNDNVKEKDARPAVRGGYRCSTVEGGGACVYVCAWMHSLDIYAFMYRKNASVISRQYAFKSASACGGVCVCVCVSVYVI